MMGRADSSVALLIHSRSVQFDTAITNDLRQRRIQKTAHGKNSIK
jgi:hypothetical protein